MWPFNRKKKKVEENPKSRIHMMQSSGVSRSRNDDSMDLTNPLNPLSPFWIGNSIDHHHHSSPDTSNNDYGGGGSFGGGGSSDSFDSGSSYDSGSSDSGSFDSGSSGSND